jgi:hypothetical protein
VRAPSLIPKNPAEANRLKRSRLIKRSDTLSTLGESRARRTW